MEMLKKAVLAVTLLAMGTIIIWFLRDDIGKAMRYDLDRAERTGRAMSKQIQESCWTSSHTEKIGNQKFMINACGERFKIPAEPKPTPKKPGGKVGKQ